VPVQAKKVLQKRPSVQPVQGDFNGPAEQVPIQKVVYSWQLQGGSRVWIAIVECRSILKYIQVISVYPVDLRIMAIPSELSAVVDPIQDILGLWLLSCAAYYFLLWFRQAIQHEGATLLLLP
jgi:hypothetical protein